MNRQTRFQYKKRDGGFILPPPPQLTAPFEYQDIKATTGDKGRVYHTPDGDYTSITTFLSQTMSEEKREGLSEWRADVGDEAADKVMEEASEFGTWVHDTLECWAGSQPLTVAPMILPVKRAVKALAEMLHGNLEEVWGLEVPLYSPTLELAGRTDVVGVWQGKPCILDYKTSLSPKTRESITDYFTQLLLYSLCHNEIYGTKIRHGVVVIAVRNGSKPQVFEQDLTEQWLWDNLEKRLIHFFGEYYEKVA